MRRNHVMKTILSIAWIVEGQGGMETVIAQMDKYLTQAGYHFISSFVGFSSRDRTWENELSDCRIGPLNSLHWKRSAISRMPQIIRWLHRMVAQTRPDIIVVHDPLSAVLVTHVIKSHPLTRNIPIAAYEHGVLSSFPTLSKQLRWAYFHGFRRVDRIICGGNDFAQALHKIFPKQAITAIGLPINYPAPLVTPSYTPFHLAFVGRLDNKQKRIDRLLTALSLLDPSLSWTCKIVGDGPDRLAAQALAQSLGIAERLEWMGWQKNPWKILAHTALLIFPSDYEGFSAVMVEAPAHGIPILATDIDFGPRNIIISGVNGWLVPPTAEAIAAQLQPILYGTISCPAPADVAQTVAAYAAPVVAQNFLSALQQTVNEAPMSKKFATLS
ncbi:MAG: glycosyltransferase [Firmicutes bacterium]|nr:glycosyltransferase [Bacillota bacterium]